MERRRKARLEKDIVTGISVIVPVYNTEQYLYACIESVLQQTYKEFELILIDDGSSDGSRKICQDACGKDKRIKAFRQEHRGISAARNVGMNMANRKYIFFLDSDDTIHPQLLENLYILQENKHAVIATAGLYYAKNERGVENVEWNLETEVVKECSYLDNDSAQEAPYLIDPKIRLCAVGGKMILRKSAGSMRFDENLTHGEDTWFLFQLLIDGADVLVLYRNWYFYRRREKSASRIYSLESCRSRYIVERRICDHYIENGKMSDAIYMEWDILKGVILWYEIGRKKKDFLMVEYIESLRKCERKLCIFSQLEWYKKILFFLGCNCYPIYKKIADRMDM